MPLSLVGTFGVMYLLGYSIDNLSLMALTISTGFVVDDAIVVIENISRYLEQGFSAEEAALRGSREIGFTVLSMSTSLIAVFIPILLMGGIVGRIFREFAVTLSVAVAISMVVSLTTTPAMCAKFLKPRKKTASTTGSIAPASSGFQTALTTDTRAACAGSCATSRWCWASRWERSAWRSISTSSIPKGFFPQQDTGRINANARASEDTSFQSMRKKLIAIHRPSLKPIRPSNRLGLHQPRQYRRPQHHAEAA